MYATILIEMGVPLIKISALLGHGSVHTTFEYYCDVMDENENILAFMNQAFVPVERLSLIHISMFIAYNFKRLLTMFSTRKLLEMLG